MTSNAREAILKNVRRNLPQVSELPGLDEAWIRYPDPLQQFADVQAMIGGRAIRVAGPDSINKLLADQPIFTDARQVVSLVPGVGRTTIDWDSIDDPHALGELDLAILPGEFAVAENAAIWISDARIRHRVVYMICEHLMIVLPASQVVHNLHEGYARLQFGQAEFGCWLAGPSKTADIEQSLVIGAHGPRSLTVFLTDD
jgi:L-lactate dehydrogenase complex protein LldG